MCVVRIADAALAPLSKRELRRLAVPEHHLPAAPLCRSAQACPVATFSAPRAAMSSNAPGTSFKKNFRMPLLVTSKAASPSPSVVAHSPASSAAFAAMVSAGGVHPGERGHSPVLFQASSSSPPPMA